jgi:hypothetical protein
MFNPLKPKLAEIILKNSVRTAKKTLHFTVTKINWFLLFKEIIAVYTEDHTKHKKKIMKSYWLLKQVGHLVTIGI